MEEIWKHHQDMMFFTVLSRSPISIEYELLKQYYGTILESDVDTIRVGLYKELQAKGLVSKNGNMKFKI